MNLANRQTLDDNDSDTIRTRCFFTKEGSGTGIEKDFFRIVSSNSEAASPADCFGNQYPPSEFVLHVSSGKRLVPSKAMASSPQFLDFTRFSLSSRLEKEIERSREILELELDDDELQIPYAEETWLRAVEFLRLQAKWFMENTSDSVFETPHILPGPDGSIDLHWEYLEYELLINIPVDPQIMAGFYGDNYGDISIKGKFDPNTINDGLLPWLTKTK